MSSLGDFLNVMYKKRELEYTAALEQSKADVAGAEAIGKGIGSIGSAIGDIGKSAVSGIGSYMQQTQGNELANQLGPQQFGQNWLGGGTRELDLRQQMGQMTSQQNQQMTPYQTAQVNQSQQRYNLDVQDLNRRIQADKDRASVAANKDASQTYTKGKADTLAYQKDTAANMPRLYSADTPELFNTYRDHQIAINQGARKAGIDESLLKQVPNEFIPKSTSDELPIDYQRYPTTPVYSPGAGFIQQGTTGVPSGAIPVGPGFTGQRGDTATYNGKPYIFDGNFMVPNPNR